MRKGRQERRGNLPQSNLPLNHCTIPPSLKPPPPDPRFPRLFPEASCPIGVFPWGELVLGWGPPRVLRKNNGVGGEVPTLPAARLTRPCPAGPGALDQDCGQRLGQVPGDVGVQRDAAHRAHRAHAGRPLLLQGGERRGRARHQVYPRGRAV